MPREEHVQEDGKGQGKGWVPNEEAPRAALDEQEWEAVLRRTHERQKRVHAALIKGTQLREPAWDPSVQIKWKKMCGTTKEAFGKLDFRNAEWLTHDPNGQHDVYTWDFYDAIKKVLFESPWPSGQQLLKSWAPFRQEEMDRTFQKHDMLSNAKRKAVQHPGAWTQDVINTEWSLWKGDVKKNVDYTAISNGIYASMARGCGWDTHFGVTNPEMLGDMAESRCTVALSTSDHVARFLLHAFIMTLIAEVNWELEEIDPNWESGCWWPDHPKTRSQFLFDPIPKDYNQLVEQALRGRQEVLQQEAETEEKLWRARERIAEEEGYPEAQLPPHGHEPETQERDPWEYWTPGASASSSARPPPEPTGPGAGINRPRAKSVPSKYPPGPPPQQNAKSVPIKYPPGPPPQQKAKPKLPTRLKPTWPRGQEEAGSQEKEHEERRRQHEEQKREEEARRTIIKEELDDIRKALEAIQAHNAEEAAENIADVPEGEVNVPVDEAKVEIELSVVGGIEKTTELGAFSDSAIRTRQKCTMLLASGKFRIEGPARKSLRLVTSNQTRIINVMWTMLTTRQDINYDEYGLVNVNEILDMLKLEVQCSREPLTVDDILTVIQQDGRERFRGLAKGTTLESVAAVSRHSVAVRKKVTKPLGWERLNPIDVPTLVFMGVNDIAIPGIWAQGILPGMDVDEENRPLKGEWDANEDRWAESYFSLRLKKTDYDSYPTVVAVWAKQAMVNDGVQWYATLNDELATPDPIMPSSLAFAMDRTTQQVVYGNICEIPQHWLTEESRERITERMRSLAEMERQIEAEQYEAEGEASKEWQRRAEEYAQWRSRAESELVEVKERLKKLYGQVEDMEKEGKEELSQPKAAIREMREQCAELRGAVHSLTKKKEHAEKRAKQVRKQEEAKVLDAIRKATLAAEIMKDLNSVRAQIMRINAADVWKDKYLRGEAMALGKHLMEDVFNKETIEMHVEVGNGRHRICSQIKSINVDEPMETLLWGLGVVAINRLQAMEKMGQIIGATHKAKRCWRCPAWIIPGMEVCGWCGKGVDKNESDIWLNSSGRPPCTRVQRSRTRGRANVLG